MLSIARSCTLSLLFLSQLLSISFAAQAQQPAIPSDEYQAALARQPDTTSDEYRAALGKDLDTLLRSDLEDHPLYLNEDETGQLYRMSVKQEKSGTYTIDEVPVSDKEVKELDAAGFHLIVIPDGSAASITGGGTMAATASSCPIPANFNISKINGTVYGNAPELVQNNTGRPASATTQWAVFEFYTKNYRGGGSHLFMSLFSQDELQDPYDLQGWGGFIGDNHGGHDVLGNYTGCGSNALFNSQIEGWYQRPGYGPASGANYQSKTFNGSNSCGSEMYDGWPWANPYYRMVMHASTGNWVGYQIDRKVGSTWVPHTSWKTLQVTSQPWDYGTPALDNTAEGIAMAATNSPPELDWQNWYIFVKNFSCGWF